jgi:hypothetical protein
MDDTRYKWLAHYTGDEEMKKLESKIKVPLKRKKLAKGLQVLKEVLPG